MADELTFPYQKTLKHVNRLVRTRLLRAKRGPRGGVFLAQPASKMRLGVTITLLEGINTTHERLDWSILKLKNQSSNVLEGAFALFIEVLDQHTVADLASNTITTKAIGAAKSEHATLIGSSA